MLRCLTVLSRTSFIVLLVGCLCSASAMAESPLQVDRSTSESLRITVAPGEVTWITSEYRDGHVALHAANIEGFALSGTPGQPRVPVASGWVVVPPGTRAELKVVEAVWRSIEPRRIAPSPMPVFRESGDPERPVLGAELLLPGDKAASGRLVFSDTELADLSADVSTSAFSLGTPGAWRGRRIAALAVRPVDVDASGSARRVLERAVLEVTFVREGGMSSPGKATPGDDHFSAMMLNGNLLPSLSADPAVVRPSLGSAKRMTKRGTLLQSEIRIPVTTTRLHRIEAAGLEAAGLLEAAGVEEGHLRLYQRRGTPDGPGLYEEIEVPILVRGDGGAFSGTDAFVFWGLRARDDGSFQDDAGDHAANADRDEQYSPSVVDPVSGGNIYYLAFSEPDAGEAWARFGDVELGAAEGTPLTSYRRTDYFEEDTYHAYAPARVTDDRFHWNSVKALDVRMNLSVKSPVPGRNDVGLRCGLIGLGTLAREVRFDLLEGGTSHLLGIQGGIDHFGEVFDTATSGSAFMSDWLVDSQLIMDNPNTLFVFCYLDWFELDYQAEYRAVNDALDFHLGEGTGAVDVEIAGFGSADLHLFDITDPRHPLRCDLGSENIVAETDGTWTLSIRGGQDVPRGRRFQAVAGDLSSGIPAFQYFRATEVEVDDDPTVAVGTPDVLVVTHPEFRDQAERWVEYRSARGPDNLQFHIVDVTQLYGWFTGGMKHPDAIKSMVEYASANWGTWALQIFGDAYQNTRTLSDPTGQRDWVPSRWHLWEYTRFANALLPSDKWFATPNAGATYPLDTSLPPEMIVARFPCNSANEAAVMVDKVIAFEASEGSWKQRSLFISDDAWSNNFGSQGSDHYHNPWEEKFETNQEAQAVAWENLGCDVAGWCEGLGLGAGRVYISEELEPISPVEPREAIEFRDLCERLVLPGLLSEISQSALFVQYQGHASDYVFADEHLIFDAESYQRQDISNFNNSGRPFVFVGLGCHIGAWARDKVEYTLLGGYPSLAEKMLRKPNSGAVATYASPGFEFLDTNATFSSFLTQAWLGAPPRGGDAGRSRWMVGELFLAAEARMLGAGASDLSRLLVAQFALLGDGLMMLDAKPPRTRMSIGWDVVEDGAEVKARDAGNELVVTLEAFDEAGVDRVEVRDQDGADVAAVITGGTPEGATTDQYVSWDVRLPFTPEDRTVVFHVYDTSDVSDDSPHATVSVVMPSTVALYLDGRQFVPGVTHLPGGTPVSLTGRVVTSSFVAADAVLAMTPVDLVLSAVSLTRVDEHTVDMEFTVEVSGGAPGVVLMIDGESLEIPLSDATAGVAGIDDVNVFPNPVSDDARFVFRTSSGVSGGTIHLYSLAGHRIASLPVRTTDFQGGGAVIVDWDGRDGEGDRPANGVYLYRVELNTAGGRVASDMQRLVIMR
jgi:peptidase C25-like protein